MFEVGTNVVYGQCGVCRVERVAPLENSPADGRQYYTLRPFFSTEVIYTPVDGKVFMRPALDREQAEAVVREIPAVREEVCTERSLTLLREKYESAFREYDCADLIGLIKSIYSKNQAAAQSGRRVGQMDQRYMKRAEELLYGELSVALGIERDQVVSYIARVLEEKKGES